MGDPADAVERITAAALRTPMMLVVTLPAPARHHDVLGAMHAAGFDRTTVLSSTQGFLTSEARFVGREEAYAIARASGQMVAMPFGVGVSFGERLFSEDLW